MSSRLSISYRLKAHTPSGRRGVEIFRRQGGCTLDEEESYWRLSRRSNPPSAHASRQVRFLPNSWQCRNNLRRLVPPSSHSLLPLTYPEKLPSQLACAGMKSRKLWRCSTNIQDCVAERRRSMNTATRVNNGQRRFLNAVV